MAYFFRLIILCVFFLPTLSFASFTRDTAHSCFTGLGPWSSPAQACSAASSQCGVGGTVVQEDSNKWACRTVPSNGASYLIIVAKSSDETCIPDSLGNCPAPTSCAVGADPSSAGATTSNGYPQAAGLGSIAPSAVCLSSCSYPAVNCVVGKTDDGSSPAWACRVGAGLGSACSPTDGAPGGGVTLCPSGQVYGTFNGRGMCLPGGNAPQTQTTTSKQTTVNGDGTTTVTTTVTNTSCNAEGACSSSVTTTTNNYSAGADPNTATPTSSTTKTEPKEQPKENFCVQNPNSPICKSSSSSFSGGCGGFTCEGDAVQCAIAREQHQRNCALFDTQTPLSDLGNKVGSGVEDLSGAGLSSAAGREVVNLASSLDQSKTLGGGCPADRTYSLWGGQTVTLPFSSLCPYLEFMGSIVLAFAYLAAARIVGVV